MAGQRSRPRGQLEQAVLDALWSADDGLSARQVLDAFPEPRPALTTVLTVLDRLRRKGQVERQTHDDAPLTFRATSSFVEPAALDRRQFSAAMVAAKLLRTSSSKNPAAVM